MATDYTISTSVNQEDADYIIKNLRTYNSGKLSKEIISAPLEKINILLINDNGEIHGGMTALIKLKCLHIEFFWVAESVRGLGKGAELIAYAEKLAAEKGCTCVKVDTFSFQAPGFYKKMGYEVYGMLEDFPEPGATHYYLAKKL